MDDNAVSRLTANLAKLKRNLDQMSPEMRVKYKVAIDKMRSQIRLDADEAYNNFLYGGRMFLSERDTAFENSVQAIGKIVTAADNAGFKKRAMDWLFECWDFESFINSLVPLYLRIWYEGYGKWYWLYKTEEAGEEPLKYHNKIIDMWWDSEIGMWCTVKDGKPGMPMTLMLPPTRELMDKAYRTEFAAYINSEWRMRIPWLFEEQFKVVFPQLHPQEADYHQLTVNDIIEGKQPERKSWI